MRSVTVLLVRSLQRAIPTRAATGRPSTIVWPKRLRTSTLSTAASWRRRWSRSLRRWRRGEDGKSVIIDKEARPNRPTGRKAVAGSQPFHPHEAAPVTTAHRIGTTGKLWLAENCAEFRRYGLPHYSASADIETPLRLRFVCDAKLWRRLRDSHPHDGQASRLARRMTWSRNT